MNLLAPTLLLLAMNAPHPVVLSTDCGAEVDDQWALAHLAISPEIDLRGVVTTHAPSLKPPAAETAARVVTEVLAGLKVAKTPPILAGSSEPLGADSAPRDNAGVRFLLDQSKPFTAENRLTVLMIGAATDVASALRLDPTWADRVRVVAMAFDGWPEGGDPWNVKNDVRAWQVVMSSRVPLVVGDSRVTLRRLTQSPDSARARFGAKASGRYLVSLLEDWTTREPKLVERISGRPATWPIWDEVVVAYLLGLTTQEERPRPALKGDRSLDHTHPSGKITWITEIDADRLWDDLARKLP